MGNGFTIKPVYDSNHFSLPLVMGAVSIAVLSFLGFDGISTLAEETKGGTKTVGRAAIFALLGVRFLIYHPDMYSRLDMAGFHYI
ncbi:hypothetical protein P9597_04700 [Aneurinibacillus migulanus]|nr:hypothetical protein [Aneurinibacillus migulanus]